MNEVVEAVLYRAVREAAVKAFRSGFDAGWQHAGFEARQAARDDAIHAALNLVHPLAVSCTEEALAHGYRMGVTASASDAQ